MQNPVTIAHLDVCWGGQVESTVVATITAIPACTRSEESSRWFICDLVAYYSE